jgi:DNA-binding winged helix-turn-helix (wHTH) protein
LAKFAPRVVKYQEIAETIWDEDSVAVRNRLKYLIYLLRKEFLNVDPETDIIQNVDRLGYKLLVRRE